MMPTVAFHTLGCKVNQYDTQAMLEVFERAGYTVRDFDARADVYVINTCTVTGTGDKKSMQAVRRAQRLNPEAEIIIAGCLAQKEGEKLLETGTRLVLGTARRGDVVSLLEEAVRDNRQIAAVSDIRKIPYENLFITHQEGRTRAVLKIQEGCDRFCAYCIIPYVRGGIRSRRPGDIREEAVRLARAGFEELVLTGIHLTSYGRDLGGETLADAVAACDIEGITRIRLGSLEPVVVTEAFVDALRKHDKVCDQFHLALQSGCDDTLKRMRRRYTTDEFRRAAGLLRQAFPHCALTTDLITGFPGESEDEFAQSLAFCREIAFSRMHVFPYSEREGTLAATMAGAVPKALREARAREMIALSHGMALDFHRKMIGQTREVLFEQLEGDCAVGYTREYVSCRAQDGQLGVFPVLITGATAQEVSGRPLYE